MKRRTRRKKWTAGYLWVVPAVAAVCVALLFYSFRHKRPSPHVSHRLQPASASHVDPWKIANQFKRVIERAGGDDVWITADRPFRGGRPVPHLATYSFGARITSIVYPQVLDAVQSEARREGLSIRERDGVRAGELPAHLIGLDLRGEPLFQFELDDVPRIIRVAIVIDDLGQSWEAAQKLEAMRMPLTFSVMPRLRYSRATADAAHRTGHEVMLHLPMQPILDSAPDVSPDEIRVGMGRTAISGIIRHDLETVPYVEGVNNHMGSRATTDPRVMSEVMSVLAAERLFFIDSVTTPDSVALNAARQASVSSFYRSVFLDDTRSVPYTTEQLHLLCRIADKRGAALAIGHPYPTTIKALALFLPQLESQDIQLVPASRLVRLAGLRRGDRQR